MMPAVRPRDGQEPLDGRLRLRDVPLVLMYHTVAEARYDPHGLAVSPRRFAEQMAWLHRRGLRGTGVGELVAAIRAGRGRGLVGITFDDGYADVLSTAVPILLEHGFGATFFVLSERLGGTNDWDPDEPPWSLLDAGGIRQLAAAGVEIGSHGQVHLRLGGCDPGTLRREVSGSRTALAELIGGPVQGFAYPYGSMDAAARAAVRAAGYTYGCAVQSPRSCHDLVSMPRLYVGENDTAMRLAAKRLLCRAYVSLKGTGQ